MGSWLESAPKAWSFQFFPVLACSNCFTLWPHEHESHDLWLSFMTYIFQKLRLLVFMRNATKVWFSQDYSGGYWLMTILVCTSTVMPLLVHTAINYHKEFWDMCRGQSPDPHLPTPSFCQRWESSINKEGDTQLAKRRPLAKWSLTSTINSCGKYIRYPNSSVMIILWHAIIIELHWVSSLAPPAVPVPPPPTSDASWETAQPRATPGSAADRTGRARSTDQTFRSFRAAAWRRPPESLGKRLPPPAPVEDFQVPVGRSLGRNMCHSRTHSPLNKCHQYPRHTWPRRARGSCGLSRCNCCKNTRPCHKWSGWSSASLGDQLLG